MDIRLKFLVALATLYVLTLLGLCLWSSGLNKEYPDLSNNDALRDTVAHIISDGGRAAARVRFGSQKKYSLPWAKTMQYGDELNLPSAVEVGDVLIKRAFSDTITIVRGDRQYIFVAHKTIE